MYCIVCMWLCVCVGGSTWVCFQKEDIGGCEYERVMEKLFCVSTLLYRMTMGVTAVWSTSGAPSWRPGSSVQCQGLMAWRHTLTSSVSTTCTKARLWFLSVEVVICWLLGGDRVVVYTSLLSKQTASTLFLWIFCFLCVFQFSHGGCSFV